MHLPGIAAHAQIAAIAVERLMPQGSGGTRAVVAAGMTAAMAAVTAATVTTTSATIMMTAAGTSAIGTLSHIFKPFLVGCVLYGYAARFLP